MVQKGLRNSPGRLRCCLGLIDRFATVQPELFHDTPPASFANIFEFSNEQYRPTSVAIKIKSSGRINTAVLHTGRGSESPSNPDRLATGGYQRLCQFGRTRADRPSKDGRLASMPTSWQHMQVSLTQPLGEIGFALAYFLHTFYPMPVEKLTQTT